MIKIFYITCLFPCLNRINHPGKHWVNQAKGGDVDPAVLEPIQVDQVQVEVGDKEAVVGSDQSHLGDRKTKKSLFPPPVPCSILLWSCLGHSRERHGLRLTVSPPTRPCWCCPLLHQNWTSEGQSWCWVARETWSTPGALGGRGCPGRGWSGFSSQSSQPSPCKPWRWAEGWGASWLSGGPDLLCSPIEFLETTIVGICN